MSYESRTPRQVHEALARGEPLVLVDVREPHEFAICAIPGSLQIPLGEIGRRAGELDRSATIVCICHHGIRSARAIGELSLRGFENLINLSGGIDRWAIEVDPTMQRYGRFQGRG